MTEKNTAPILDSDDDDHVVVVVEGAEIVLDADEAAEIVVDDTDPPIAEPAAPQAEAPEFEDVFIAAAPPPVEPAATEAPPRDTSDDALRAAIARKDSEIVELRGQLAAVIRERDEARAQAIEGAAAVATLAEPFYKSVEAQRAAGRGLMAYPGSLSKPARASLRDAVQSAAEMIDAAAKEKRPAQIEFSARDISTLAPTKPPKPQPKKKGFFS